ncbi:MAG: DNA glycosylase [Candidatus Bathyarchaeia archaeon]
MKIQLDPSCPFNLEATLCCGQAFRWDKQGEWWYGVIKGNVLKIRQIGEELEFENVDRKLVEEYFGLHDNLPEILSQISRDEHIRRAAEIFKGLRILRQEPWECLISYICATYKSIPAIKKMLRALSMKFGDKISFEGHDFYVFPPPERLAKATFKELAECGLGYRTKFVYAAAKKVYEEHFNLESLRKMPYEKAKMELLKFLGVGFKVADCVLLFSLEKLEAFPVDVWMKRVILKYYWEYFPKEFIVRLSRKESLSQSDYKALNLFGRRYFGRYAGYAQEYLYHFERTQI